MQDYGNNIQIRTYADVDDISENNDGENWLKSYSSTQINLVKETQRNYLLLNMLQNKGIISVSFDHPIRFTAMPLETAMWSLVNAEKEHLKTLETQQQGLVRCNLTLTAEPFISTSSTRSRSIIDTASSGSTTFTNSS